MAEQGDELVIDYRERTLGEKDCQITVPQEIVWKINRLYELGLLSQEHADDGQEYSWDHAEPGKRYSVVQ